MHRALVGHIVQFLALGVGQHALEGQFDVQGIFAFQLFAGVVFDFDRDPGQRDLLSLRIELERQCLAGAQGGIEIVMGGRRAAFAAHSLGQIGEHFVVVDLDAVTKTFV